MDRVCGGHQQRDPGTHGVVGRGVVHMDLYAPDGLPLELGEGRREVAQPHAVVEGEAPGRPLEELNAPGRRATPETAATEERRRKVRKENNNWENLSKSTSK